MLIVKPLSEEISIDTANTVSDSKLVRVYNANTAAQIITIANSSANVSSFTLAPDSSAFVEKENTHTIQGSSVLACSIAYKG